MSKKIVINESQLKKLIRKINIKNILSEEIKNKSLVKTLSEKWKIENPNLSDEETDKIISDFNNIKGNLAKNQPQVYSFLSKYDGNLGHKLFNENDLKDIKKYDYDQIIFLLEQYTDVDLDVPDEDNISTKKNILTDDIVNASKKLWFGEKYLIIDDGNFRVYDIPNQATSIRFGYYAHKVGKDLGGLFSWCVTWTADRTNRWGGYRPKRTFYFVIDESKNPEIEKDPEKNKYYLGALQNVSDLGLNNNLNGFRLTSVKNDGDKEMTWEQISSIYPKLAEHKDLINFREYSEEEVEIKTIVGQMVENSSSRFDFKRQSRQHKKSYIDHGNSLSKPESWLSLDTILKNAYINLTTKDNVYDKFNNLDFISEIRKDKPQFKLLDNKLIQIGLNEGVASIIEKLLGRNYKVSKVSVKNNSIKLIENTSRRSYGIFDYQKGNFLEKDNIIYDGVYNERNIKRYFHLEGDVKKVYIVEEYSINKNINERTFYAIYERDPKQTHFMSRNGFLKLLSDNPNMYEEGYEPDPNDKMFKNKPETDINEFKRRY